MKNRGLKRFFIQLLGPRQIVKVENAGLIGQCFCGSTKTGKAVDNLDFIESIFSCRSEKTEPVLNAVSGVSVGDCVSLKSKQQAQLRHLAWFRELFDSFRSKCGSSGQAFFVGIAGVSKTDLVECTGVGPVLNG
jgi:hypothetical protein